MEYSDLDALIDDLEEAVQDTNPRKGYWKELWALAGRIKDGLREGRYPTPEQKQAAWNRVKELEARARTRSDEQKARFDANNKAWEQRKTASRNVLDGVQSLVAGAAPTNELERMLGTIIGAPIIVIFQLLESALNAILRLEDVDQIKGELLNCNEQMRKAWALFTDSKNHLLPGDKAKAYQALKEMQERVDDAWTRWKDLHQRAHEKRQEEWEQRRREREEKRARFVERVEANIAKLEEKLDKARGALRHNEDHLDELQSKYSDAWSDGFRDRCGEWISECEAKIENIKEHIGRLEGWLDEERDKLRS